MDKFENHQTQNLIFTKWFNNKLKKVYQPAISNLVDGFKSARRLYSISNVLCENENLEIPEQLDDRQLVSKGLENLCGKFKISLPMTIQQNIDDINNGEENVIMDLSWWIITAYFAHKGNTETDKIVNDTLFWCQRAVKGYRGVSITNFTNSWRDGCALLAIIHHHKHSLFDFESRLSKTAGQNLTLALHLASQEFKCARLLELDHFTMSLVMDWKCICLLLMELRQCIDLSLHQSVDAVNSAEGEDIGTKYMENPMNRSFQSMLAHFGDIFKNTNNTMDSVTQQLNQTDNRVSEYEETGDANHILDKFDKDQELFTHLKIIKESAVEHEALMEMLATHQETVQITLMSGNGLLDIKSVENTAGVTSTIKSKLEATTNKWNSLYNRATVMQKKLRKLLYNIQMSFLIKIENCIDNLEEIRKGQNTFGNTIDQLKEELKINRSMEVEIEITEKYIAELANFLIYSEDSDSSDDEEVSVSVLNEDQMKRISRSISDSSFEHHIQSIGKRWNDLVSWVRCRYDKLQKTLLSLRHFDEEIQGIYDWLEERICSADQLIRKSSRNQFNDFVNYTDARWGRSLLNLDNCAQKVKSACDNQPEMLVTIDAKIDAIVQEWSDASEKWRDSLDNWIGVDDKRRSNRAASFSDMSSENCFNRRKIESTNKNTTASLDDMNISIAPVQAAYKTKFEADAERMMSWLENSAEKLELITLESISPEERPTILEQRKTIDTVSEEMNLARSKKSMDSIKRMGLMYQEDLNKSGENTDEIEQLFDELDERWSYLESQLVKSRQKVLSIELCNDLEKRSETIDSSITNALAFLQNIKTDPDLVNIDKLINDVSQLRERFINEKNILKQFTDAYLVVKSDLTPLNEENIDKRIAELNHKILNQIEIIENEQVKLRNNRTMLELNVMPTEQWLNDTSDKVNAKIVLSSFEHLTDETMKLKSLESQLEYHSQLLSKIKVPDASSKRFKILMDLQKICRSIGQRLENRLRFLNDLSEKCNQWQNQIQEFEQWLGEVDSYLNEFENQKFQGEEMISESIKETDGGIQDLQNLLPTLVSIEQATVYLEAYFTKEFKTELYNKKEHLQKIWKSSQDKYVNLKEYLQVQLNKSEDIKTPKNKIEPQKVAEIVEHELTTEDDLVDIDMEHCSVVSDSSSTHSGTEETERINVKDQDLVKEIQQWIDTCRIRLMKFSEIDNNEELSQFGSLIGEIEKSKISYNNKINQITANDGIKESMSQLSEYLEKEAQRYSSSNYHLKNFQSILSDEDTWVGKVNHVVQQSLSCNQLDVEELSENIDEIERVVCDHSEEDVNRLEDLKYSLMNARVLERSVSMEFDQIKEKSSVTKDKAKKHLSSLQQLLDHLQSVERRSSQMITWINDTTKLIKSRIAADLLGSDTPEEFEILKQSFAEWEKFLQEMEDLEKGKRYQGRKEASERLRLQRNQIQKLFRPLKDLFSRYSRPGDFEPRLNNFKREVNRVGEQIYLLDIISISPDDLDSGLYHAKQFHESLVLVKEDLNYVYDLGKRLAEKKEIEFADRFSVQLDSLKKKYYDLLDQINEAEQRLTSAKPIIDDLYAQVQILDSLVDSEPNNESNVNVKDNEILVSKILELCEKLKPYTDYDRSDLVKDMFDEIKEKCDQILLTKQSASKADSKEIITIDELCEEADQLLSDINDYDFSDTQTLEEKIDTIYGRTSQLRQAATQIMTQDPVEADSDQSNKYDYLQHKLGRITEILSSHQNINGCIKYDEQITDTEKPTVQEDEIVNEIICSKSAGSLNQEVEISTFTSRENSFADSLSSPISTEDMSNSENVVSDISYSIQAAKIEQSILHQVSTEMKDHIHSFILFCQNNIGSGMAMSPGLGRSHALITTTSELRSKINIFREQRLYLDHRLRELSAYAETSDQMEELDKIQRYWQESIGKLNKRIDRLTELDKRLEVIEDSFKDPELQSSEKVRTKVLRLLCQIEEELNVNLQKDKLRVTSHNRFGSQDSGITKSNSAHSMNISMTQDMSGSGDCYRDSLKVVREQLKEVGKRLNSVRIAIDDSRRGCLSKLADRIQEIDENLNDSSHILTEVQYNMVSSIDHQNNDAVNLNFLVEAQRKRLTKYNNEFHSYIRKWMENATKWQEFVERLERLQFGLDDIEQELVSVVNGLDYSEEEVTNIKKSLSSFEKKLVQLEQDGERLSISCNDIDADFIHNRLSDLRSRYTLCLQSNMCTKLGIRRVNVCNDSTSNSADALYNGNLSDSTSTEKICDKSSTELKQSRSSELDFNANTLHSSEGTFPNEDYDSASSGSSDELSTMVDGAATILDGRLINWARLTNEMINNVFVTDFDCIDALEDKINEFTSIKKEALERTVQITMGMEKEKHSINDSNSTSAEISSTLTDESNAQLLIAYQELKTNLYSKIDELCELKARYYHIKEQLTTLENLISEMEMSDSNKMSENLQNSIKTETAESKLNPLRELITKMPNGLKEDLEAEFNRLAPTALNIQQQFADDDEFSNKVDEHANQLTQESINQIALLLKSINTFMVKSKVNLGRTDDIDQCLDNMKVYYDQMDRHRDILLSVVEKRNLETGYNTDPNYIETVDRVDRLWNNTENKLQQREEELIKMRELKSKLDEIESSLNEWMQQSDGKLNQLLAEGLGAKNQKILDDVKNDIPNWQQTLNVYQSLSYDLTNTYSSENCQDVEANLERMNRQWSAVMNKLAKCSREISFIKTPLELSRPELNEATEVCSSMPNEIENELSIEKLSGWLSSLEGQLETIEMGIVRWRSGSGSIGTTNADKLKLKVITQLNEMQNEIKHYEKQFQACSESERNESEYQIATRWKIVKRKVNEIIQTLEGTPESGQQLLTKLRLLNDWLAHKDADLLEQKESPVNNYVLAHSQLRKFETLYSEIESHRVQIEETIEQAQNMIGEVIDPNKSVEQFAMSNAESEGESDNSDTGSSTKTTDDKSKRLLRRLRRHSHHLKRKWVEINLKSKEHQETLKRKIHLLKSVESQIKESEQLLSEVEFHIDSWSKVSNINASSLPQEVAQTKTLLQSIQPIIDKFNSIDTHRSQLHKMRVVLSDQLIDELEKINSRISSIRSLCETRLKQLHQHEMFANKQSTLADNQPSIFAHELPMESASSVSRKMTFPHGLAENRKFIELENESVSYPWERCLHPSGSEVPYYKNHSTQDTQWDHPIMAELIKSFDELNTIRFSAYRTAMKLRALQKTLCMDLIDLSLAAETFKMSGLLSSAVNERLLDVGQIIVFLASLYRSVNQKLSKSNKNQNTGHDGNDKTSHSILGCARGSSIRHSRTKQKSHHTRSNSFSGFKNDDEKEELGSKASCIKSPSRSATSQAVIMKCPVMANVPLTRTQLSSGDSEINVPVCVDLALNWLLNVYDSARNGKIRVLSLKVAIVIMSNAYLDEKYKYLFSLICNNQGQIDCTRLTFLLTDCILLPKHLNESSNFGTESVEPSVLSCFKNSIDAGANRFIRLSHFLSWLKLEPQSLVWLPVLHRLVSAECAVHQAKCGVCKIQPIVGLRYRCLRCFNFDLCQACFFYSKTGKGHKVSHPMQEYCNVTSSKENIRDYSRIFRNRFRSKSRMRREPKLGYLPVQNATMQDQSEPKSQPNTNTTPETSSTNRQIHNRVEMYANRLAEVEQLKHSTEGSTDLPMAMNNLLSLPDASNKAKEQNRNDEEHRLIAKYADTLRAQMRNESTMAPKSVNNHATLPRSSVNNSMETVQPMPPFHKPISDYYAVPLNKSTADHRRFHGESESHHPTAVMSHPVANSSEDPRVQNSNASLNRLIHGLESQKRQLLDEYERLQSQTPVNNYNMQKSPYLSMNQGPRYATVDLGPSIGSRGTPFNQSLPPISSRTTSRPYGAFSNTGSLERSNSNLPSSDLISEARMLREHKGKLENRMGLLEQRNRQLETQLNMLRQLIDDSPNTQNNRVLLTPSNNVINAFLQNNGQYDQDAEMLTAAQYAASKRINEISCVSPNVGGNYIQNNYRFPGNSDHDMGNRGYPYSSGLYTGPRPQTSQNMYGSLERGSSYRAMYDTTPVASNYRSPLDRGIAQPLTPNAFLPGQQLKAASDTGGSLSDSDFQMMCRSLADSCPTVTVTPTYGQSTNSIGSLFHMAGQVGKAVGQLVNVMTDDFNTTAGDSSATNVMQPNTRVTSQSSGNNSVALLNEDLVLPTSQSIINNTNRHTSDSN